MARSSRESAAHVLCVDVGNTVTRFGLFSVGGKGAAGRGVAAAGDKGTAATGNTRAVETDAKGAAPASAAPDARASHAAGTLPPAPELLGSCELTTAAPVTADEALIQARHALGLLGGTEPDGTILSCVVPSVAAAWKSACARCCPARPLVVGPGLKSGVAMRYDDPGEVGSDRLANVVAARTAYGWPVVVIDLGTTTNFDVVDANGAFAGGIIAPGVALGARALSEAAARLPEIELAAPRQVIGRSTRAAMQSGLVLGEVARIDGLLDGVLAELGVTARAMATQEVETAGSAPADVPATARVAARAGGGLPGDSPAQGRADGTGEAHATAAIVLTGDGAAAIAQLLRHPAHVDKTLTLRGLALLWMKNQRRQSPTRSQSA